MVPECGTKRAVIRRNSRKPRPPLSEETLAELALAYVGRFATSRARLAAYLERKLRERGWSGDGPAEVDGLVERFSASGYVDDSAYALARSRSLANRGYGAARVRQSLRAAGIEEGEAAAALELADSEAIEAALHFARRRRLGPFAPERADRDRREKAIAAMIRAGHGFALARTIVELEPGEALPDGDYPVEGRT